MGFSQDYANVPDWVANSEGYQTGAMVKYQGNIFYANFWASEPGVGDAEHNGWRFYDELYDQSPHTPTEHAKIIAYIPTWRKKEGFNYANDEMYQYITHGIISFLMFSETNVGEFEPKSLDDVNAVLSEVVNTGHRNGTRISIALGGAVDYGFLNLMTSVGNNSDNPLLDRAVQNVVNFVNSNNLDGVDLDLECWWGKPGEQDQGGRPKSEGPHPAGFALTLFAQKLKQAMPDKLVSAALFGTSWYGNNYDPKLADSVDWLAIMTYDLTGSWNNSPVGPQTALLKIRNQESSNIRTQESYQESYVEEQQGEWPGGGIVNNPILSVEDTLWYWTNPLFVNWQGAGQKIPRNRIAVGVPLYGYDFSYGKDPDDVSGEVPPGYKVMRYKDILAQFPDAHMAANGNIKVEGSTLRPPFISASGNYPYAHNIYFETPDTAITKLKFLKDIGANGVIIWELSNDIWEEGKSIIKALYRNSGNPRKETSIALPLEVEAKYTVKLGVEIDTEQWNYTYPVCFPFNIGDRTFIFGHGAAGSRWFIQELLPGGKLAEEETHAGAWNYTYPVCFPFNIGGRTFIFGHGAAGILKPHYWFIQELLPGGKLAEEETHAGAWNYTYPVCFPFNIGDRTFIFGHGAAGILKPHYWFIQELLPGGKLAEEETHAGAWNYTYPVCFPFNIGDRTFIFGHGAAGSRWFIQELLPGGKLAEEETHAGAWNYTYPVCFPFNIGGRRTFIFGHGAAGSRWFIQELLPGGKLAEEETHAGAWNYTYPVCFPFNIGGRTFIFGHGAAGILKPHYWFIHELVKYVELLDVWGEGRIKMPDGFITGFSEAWNINKDDKKISNGPNTGKDIPNLEPIFDYDNPKFPRADSSVVYMTVMGSPIEPATAREMYRVLDKKIGVVILYDLDSSYIKNFEDNMGKLVYKPQNPLKRPFDEPSPRPVRIYGFPEVTDHDEL